MLDKFIAAVVSIPLAIGGWFGLAPDQSSRIADLENKVAALQEETLGAFSPAAGGTYRLQSSIGTTDTTVTLSSFKEPVSEIPITMTSLNSDIGYATIDPQSSTRKEFISFTGVTQNSDGTAQLTGVSRGLAFLSPFTASSTLRKAHPGQSILILSDSPQLFNEYALKRSNETITGQWTFTNFPVTASTSFSSETVGGIVELATIAEAGSSTASGTVARLALPASIATSTCPTVGQVVPVTASSTGELAESCFTASRMFGLGSTTVITSSTASTTFYTSSLSANALNPNINPNVMYRFTMPYRYYSVGTLFLEFGYGNATTSMVMANSSAEGNLEWVIVPNSPTSVTSIIVNNIASSTGVVHGTNASSTAAVVANTLSVNSLTAQPLSVVLRSTDNGVNVFRSLTVFVEILR